MAYIPPSSCFTSNILANQKQPKLAEVLEQDLNSDNEIMSARDMLEVETKATADQNRGISHNSVFIQNLLKRTLTGMPLTLSDQRKLTELPGEARAGLEQLLDRALRRASGPKAEYLKCLLVELGLAGVLPLSSKLFSLAGVAPVKRSTVMPPTKLITKQTFALETFGFDKIVELNNSISLMSSFSAGQVAVLASSLGDRVARKVSSRLVPDCEALARAPGLPDLSYLMLAKLGQLKRLERWAEARQLLERCLTGPGRGERLPGWLVSQLEAEQQLLNLQEAGAGQVSRQLLEGNSLARACSPTLTTTALTAMLNAGHYEAVVRLTMPGLPHISSCPHPQASVVLMARALAQLLLAQHAANPVAVKKCGREVWETLCGAVQGGSGKRSNKGESADNAASRAAVTTFLCELKEENCSRLASSLAASLSNVVRDDPNTDILSPEGSLWPTHTNLQVQERAAEEVVTRVVRAALATRPKDPTLLRMTADLEFAASPPHYAAALALYVEAAAARTDFFQVDLGLPGLAGLEDGMVGRMVTCVKELGRFIQAVVLSQFSPEPNYAQAFKFLEDRSVDGSDSLYGCIWDMAVLEFAMSLHTKRGEVARRRQALQCIHQLELNTNNEEEIIKEAANVRKAMFLRSLSMQMF